MTVTAHDWQRFVRLAQSSGDLRLAGLAEQERRSALLREGTPTTFEWADTKSFRVDGLPVTYRKGLPLAWLGLACSAFRLAPVPLCYFRDGTLTQNNALELLEGAARNVDAASPRLAAHIRTISTKGGCLRPRDGAPAWPLILESAVLRRLTAAS